MEDLKLDPFGVQTNNKEFHYEITIVAHGIVIDAGNSGMLIRKFSNSKG